MGTIQTLEGLDRRKGRGRAYGCLSELGHPAPPTLGHQRAWVSGFACGPGTHTVGPLTLRLCVRAGTIPPASLARRQCIRAPLSLQDQASRPFPTSLFLYLFIRTDVPLHIYVCRTQCCLSGELHTDCHPRLTIAQVQPLSWTPRGL